jgi:hypothetical protein
VQKGCFQVSSLLFRLSLDNTIYLSTMFIYTTNDQKSECKLKCHYMLLFITDNFKESQAAAVLGVILPILHCHPDYSRFFYSAP